MEKTIKIGVRMLVLLAHIGVCNASTTIFFDQQGIDYPLVGGDITLVPATGVDTLLITAEQKSYKGTVTISDTVTTINFCGENTVFERAIVLNAHVVLKFLAGQCGHANENTLTTNFQVHCEEVILEAWNQLNVSSQVCLGQMTIGANSAIKTTP
jgi:hypothetical protein